MSKTYVPISGPIWWNDMPITGTYDRIVRAALGKPTTTRSDDGTYSHTWEFSGPFASPPLLKPTVRPIAVIEAEIRRAAVLGLRRDEV